MARPKKDQTKKYTENLTKRIPIQKISVPRKTTLLNKGTFPPTLEKNADLKKIQSQNLSTIGTEMFQKMILLLEHYGIDPSNPNCWLSLSLRLACDHVEGFKVVPKSGTGRKKDWTNSRLAELYFDVELKRWTKPDKEQQSVSWACTQLSKSEKWGGITPKILQNRHTEAKGTPEISTFLSLERMISDPSKMVDLMKYFKNYLNKSTSE